MNAPALSVAIDVVADILGLEPHDVTPTSDFSDLGADQLAMTDIVTELELRLNVELPTALEDAETVAELAAGLERALAATEQRTGMESMPNAGSAS